MNDNQEPVELPAQPDPRAAVIRHVHRPVLISGMLLGLAVIVLGFVSGGPVGRVALYGLEAYPFALIAVLAYKGITGRVSRVLAWLFAWLALVLLALGSDLMVSYVWPRWGERITASTNVLFVISIVTALMALVPMLRRGFVMALPRLLPLEPANNVHVLALFFVLSVTILMFVPLLVLGNALFLEYARLGEYSQYDPHMDPRLGVIAGLIWMIPCTVVATGYGITRTFSQSLERLGVVKPTWRQLLFAVGCPVILIPLFVGFGFAVEHLWNAAGWPVTDAGLLEQLFTDFLTPTAGILLAVGAGVGEELVVRGLLQPRLGILISNLFFTALHAMQYNGDGLLQVFALGMIMGLIRRRSNTVVCIIIHTLYDAAVILLVLLAG